MTGIYHICTMYELNQTPFGSRQRFDIFHKVTGTGFSIVPDAGATVLSIQFNGKNILDGYETPEELEEGKWGKSSVLFPFPNRLNDGKYTWNNTAYQFPINNESTGNAIHGFVRHESFEVTEVLLTQNSASIRCMYEYEGDKPYYPFPFLLQLEFTISDDGRFTVTVDVDNLGETTMPFGFGWHPYFRLAENAGAHALGLPDCARVEISDRMIPTGVKTPFDDYTDRKEVGDTFLDNCFIHTGNAEDPELVLEGEAGVVTVQAPANQFPFFQVFTPPHRESIALEPMTCNIDVLNNHEGLTALGSHDRWTGKLWIVYQ